MSRIGSGYVEDAFASHPVLTRVAIVAAVAAMLIVAYVSSYFACKTRIPITTYEGTPLYYFSKNRHVNTGMWIVFWPIHRSTTIKVPKTFREWMSEQKNSAEIFIYDVSDFEGILDRDAYQEGGRH